MERDKVRQLEKDRESIVKREEDTQKAKWDEKEALEIIKSTVKEREKSRFVSNISSIILFLVLLVLSCIYQEIIIN